MIILLFARAGIYPTHDMTHDIDAPVSKTPWHYILSEAQFSSCDKHTTTFRQTSCMIQNKTIPQPILEAVSGRCIVYGTTDLLCIQYSHIPTCLYHLKL